MQDGGLRGRGNVRSLHAALPRSAPIYSFVTGVHTEIITVAINTSCDSACSLAKAYQHTCEPSTADSGSDADGS